MKIEKTLTFALFVSSIFLIHNALAIPQAKSNTIFLAKADGQKSTHTFADTAITAKIKEKFIEEKLFDKKDVKVMSVHVKTINGVVQLTGKVSSDKQAENAVAIAKSVDGVKEVKSQLEVHSSKSPRK